MKWNSLLIMLLWALPSLSMERAISLRDFADGLYQGNNSVIRSWIAMAKSGMVDVNTKDKHGWTALMHAAYADNFGRTVLQHAAARNNLEAIKELLIAPNIDVNTKDNLGRTALMHAAAVSNLEAIKELLKAPNIDVNAKDKNGRTALMYAAMEYFAMDYAVKAIKELLKAGADVNTKDNDGRTVLILATINNKSEAMKELLNAPNIDVNAKNNSGTALMHAIDRGHKSVARLLWSVGANDPGIKLTPEMESAKDEGLAALDGIITALRSANHEALRKYHDQGFSVMVRDAEGNGPLHLAIKEGEDRKNEINAAYS
jgi:uncharacterized protein